MTIVHVTSEVAPFSKTGGLADVTGSLPAALARAGADTVVISPAYPSVREAGHKLAPVAALDISLAGKTRRVELLQARSAGVGQLFIDCPEYFDRAGLYGETGQDYTDNAERFLLLCRSALAALDRLAVRPDIIHCHDWQTGLLPLLARTERRELGTVFTIHNLGYQGLFPAGVFPGLGLPDSCWSPDGLEYFDQVSFLKAGLVYADRLTTVSPTYAREIQEPELGFGMDPILRARSEDLHGILNGIDTEYWNPKTDPHLPARYSADRTEGKAANRRALAEELKFLPDGPLFGMVSRLAGQKGIDLVLTEIPRLAGLGARVCILGTGQPEYHAALKELVLRYPGSVAAVLGFDEALAHRIYAASDFFLMPSEYEPCGLGQMIALRYGTLPVAARTGGLADTVFEATDTAGNGFIFERGDAAGFAAALDRAVALYSRPGQLAAARRRGMETDFSWGARADEYLALYRNLIG